MELARVTKPNLDISGEGELLTYTYSDTEPREIIAQVSLGDSTQGIAGAGSYVLRVYIDDVVVSPNSRIDVDTGVTKTIVASRPIPIDSGDVIKVTVTGLPADTAVNCITSLRDATPLRADELTGGGEALVDHDYGSADALTVMTPAGARVDNATILAYRQSDYDAGRRTPEYVVASTKTDVNGRWASPMMLDPGNYTLLVYKQGAIQSTTVDLIVS